MLFANLKDKADFVESEVDIYLNQISGLSNEMRLEKILQDYIGNPYEVNPLKKEEDGKPSISLYYVDCTVFVLNSAALFLSQNYSEFIDNYTRAAYYSRVVSYNSRIHFSEDRLITNSIFQLVFPEELESIIKEIPCVLNVKENGSRLLETGFEKKIIFKYIDYTDAIKKKILDNFIKNNEKNYGIVFIRKKNIANGHLISHEGFVCGNKIIHAGKNAGKVTEENKFQLYMHAACFDGISLFNFDPKK